MPFLFICNPRHGEFVGNAERLASEIVTQGLNDYENWIPALYVDRHATLQALEAFMETYDAHQLALVYYGKPELTVCSRIAAADDNIAHYVFRRGRVESDYMQSTPDRKRVLIVDSFQRQARNADYLGRELFTDLNTRAGNQNDMDFGDFSIVGDHYTDTGGPAHAVALHHIHVGANSSLMVSHFISDRTDTAVDPGGKTIEAVVHLTEALNDLQPNNTRACNDYRTMRENQQYRGLGYMKRIAIKHHLEVMLSDGGLGR